MALIGDVLDEDETVEHNPHLPEPPADGKHDFGESSTRCNLCGAYRGSRESTVVCKGQWTESGKMRSYAARRWMEDRLKEGGPVLDVIESSSRQLAGRRMGGVLFMGTARYFIRLECGHEREVGYLVHEALKFGSGCDRAACVEPSCAFVSMTEHAKLNPHWVPKLEALEEAKRVLREGT